MRHDPKSAIWYDIVDHIFTVEDHTCANGPRSPEWFSDCSSQPAVLRYKVLHLPVTKIEIDYTAICVNGAGKDATCKAGDNASAGIGLLTWNVGDIRIRADHLNVDGYKTPQFDY